MIQATEILSQFVAGLTYDDLPADVVRLSKQYIVDYYAACFAGMKINAPFNAAVEELLVEQGGAEQASVLCSERKLPAREAAFLNAVYAHGADMDDGNRKAMGHVAAHVMSAVFALAEMLGASGKDVIVAINAGYEVYNRVAASVQPQLARRGFHSTGTAGAIACGAAAAKLLGLDEKGVYNALSMAAVQSSGLLVVLESGQATKPVNPANAARVGILSAQLAQKGVQAPRLPLESKKGWFHAMADTVDETAVTEGLGEVFTIAESYLKPYPSCRHTHCGIEAAIGIREQITAQYGRVDASTVDSVTVYIYSNAINIAGQIVYPQTDEDAKFSIHYALATALLKGRYTLDDLSVDNLTDEVRCVIDKTQLVCDESMEDRKRGVRGARVVVTVKDGTQFSETVLIPKGDAANPFSDEDLREKLCVCAEGVISQAQQQRLLESVYGFEDVAVYRSINSFL